MSSSRRLAIRHGEENAPYFMREDNLLRTQGLKGVKREHAKNARGCIHTLVSAAAQEEG